MADTTIAMPDGRRIDPLALRPEDVRIDEIAHALSNLCRWGGRTSEFYSVAQHSVWVAQRVEDQFPDLGLHALLHDAAEAYLLDVPTPIKRVTSIDGVPYSECEYDILSVIERALGLPIGADSYAVIRAVDDAALATEARDLMGGLRWDGMAEAHGPTLEPLSQRAARTQFLRMFERLRDAAKVTR